MNTALLIIASLLGCLGGLALLGSAGYGLYAFFKKPADPAAVTPEETALHNRGRNLLIVAAVLFMLTCCCLPLVTFGINTGINALSASSNDYPEGGYGIGNDGTGNDAFCDGHVYAIDPKNPTALGLTAPAGSIVLVETVNHTAKTITLTFFLANEPVTAYTSGSLDVNVWYGYCTLSSANEATLMQKEERESDTWADGYVVNIVTSSFTPSASLSCAETIMAINPGTANHQKTPAGVYVVEETVNYDARTVTIRYFYADQPVEASINGAIHVNVWYGYCNLQSAQNGAMSQKAERESEAAVTGSWADDFTVILLEH